MDVHFTGQQRGDKFHRVVGFQVSRLEGYERIGSTVRLVESVAAEFLHEVEKGFRRLDFSMAVVESPL
jgi:electron transfer flavoprotein alpha/beta subunit